MNWLTYLMRSLQLLPVVVAGIEQIHGEAPGTTKKQMAIDALNLATGSAEVILPQFQAAETAAATLTSNIIDGVVDVFNKTGTFQTSGSTTVAKPAPAPAPAAVAASPVPAPAAAAAPAPAPTPVKAAAAVHAPASTHRVGD